MGFYDRLKKDNKRILGGEDMRPITLYNKSDVSKAGFARYTDIEFNVDVQTGASFNSKKQSVAFHIADFADITGVKENYKGWQAEVINALGETVRGIFHNQYVDRDLGYVLTNLTSIKE